MQNNQPIIQSLTTEKSSTAQSNGKYTFIIAKNATKIDIKRAIRELYGAEVATVRTILTYPKTRLLRGKYEWIKKPVMKKAIVTLKGNKTIDPNKIGSSGKTEKSEKATTKAKSKKVAAV